MSTGLFCRLVSGTRNITVFRFFEEKMSYCRYFNNPYRLEDENPAIQPLNLDEDLRTVKKNLGKIVETIVRKEPAERAETDGGLYVGSAGICYAFLHLSQSTLNGDGDGDVLSKEYLSIAQRYLDRSLSDLEKRSNLADCSFLLGDGGVLAVGSVVALRAGDVGRSEALAKRYLGMAEFCKPENFSPGGSDEFFVGRAGYLYGSLWLNKQLGKIVVPIDVMQNLARVIVDSGKNYARKSSCRWPLMYAYHGTEYIGAAHGIASILQILIQVPDFLATNKEADTLVRNSIDYLLSLETSSGNYPCALDELDENGRDYRNEEIELVHWCHGAPGVVYLMAAAYLRWNDVRYLEACQRAGDLVWRKGLLTKGPGICHGVAGSGYVFLLLYRLTSDPRYLKRALKFADFLNSDNFKNNARTPDSPYSLYEGIAGTACFLVDLTQPDKAAFPFQDVF